MSLEAILKDNRTRVDENGHAKNDLESQEAKPAIVKNSVEATETIPVINPPKPEFAAATGDKLSGPDRSMIVDSDRLTERIPVIKEPVRKAGIAEGAAVPSKTEPRPEPKPIEIQIIPRRRTSPLQERRNIPLQDVTKNQAAEPKSPILQATASRVIDTPSSQSAPLMQWRTHPDAKRTATLPDDGFVAVGSRRSAAQPGDAVAPGPFPADQLAKQNDAQSKANTRVPAAETNDSASEPATPRSSLWLLGGVLILAIATAVFRRRRSLQG